MKIELNGYNNLFRSKMSSIFLLATASSKMDINIILKFLTAELKKLETGVMVKQNLIKAKVLAYIGN